MEVRSSWVKRIVWGLLTLSLQKGTEEERLSLLDIIMRQNVVWSCYNHLINMRGQVWETSQYPEGWLREEKDEKVLGPWWCHLTVFFIQSWTSCYVRQYIPLLFSGSPSVVPIPATSASPGKLLETHILGPHSDQLTRKSGAGPREMVWKAL